MVIDEKEIDDFWERLNIYLKSFFQPTLNIQKPPHIEVQINMDVWNNIVLICKNSRYYEYGSNTGLQLLCHD